MVTFESFGILPPICIEDKFWETPKVYIVIKYKPESLYCTQQVFSTDNFLEPFVFECGFHPFFSCVINLNTQTESLFRVVLFVTEFFCWAKYHFKHQPANNLFDQLLYRCHVPCCLSFSCETL